MKRFFMSVPKEMYAALEDEMKKRKLDSMQETVRQLLSEYLREKQ